MIKYNPKEWFSLIFRFHKSDTFRKLFWLLCSMAFYSWLIAYIEIEILHLKFRSTTAMHSLLGFVISLLLVFRTNTAYDRWWEGRKMWGNLLNVSRNMAIKLQAFIPQTDMESRDKLSHLLSEYAVALRDHLSRNIAKQNNKPHQPNLIASEIFDTVNKLYKNNTISGNQLIIINTEISELANICGACERIKKTPIPYSYSLFIKKFIFIYIMTMPFGFISDFGYWIILLTVFVLYVLVSIEMIAEEIEDPFGNDSNDLPMDEIAQNIKRSVTEIMRNK